MLTSLALYKGEYIILDLKQIVLKEIMHSLIMHVTFKTSY